MKFVDSSTIYVEAGSGGHGCISLKREACMPKGGPDGGDGGDGGNVYLRASSQLNTLLPFQYKSQFAAKRGADGSGNQKTGKRGSDLYLDVPLGTEVYNQPTGECLGTLLHDQQCLLVARGGERGLGNIHFKNSVRQTPRIRTLGTPGEQRCLQLQLKVLADVGLVGIPNAGKSTLLRAITQAVPKVADYPFTTTSPNLGVVQLEAGQDFVVVDVPPLVEDSAAGRGLGIEFLKHVERSKILLYLIDSTNENYSQQVQIIEEALQSYPQPMLHQARWLVFNKIDDCQEPEFLKQSIKAQFADRYQCWLISSLKGDGLNALCHALGRALLSQ